MTDILDKRDAILSALSAEIAVNVVQAPDGTTSIYAAGGAVLFNRVPRAVTFAPTDRFAPGAAGNAVFIDGVNVTSATSPMKISGGRLSGSIEIRDVAAPLAQAQLDEIARGLVAAFSERDVSSTPQGPALPGLFTYPGAGPSLAPVTIAGLASSLRINPTIDPSQGGSILLLRDGGAADPGNPAYVANPTRAAGYSERLLAYVDALSAPQPFDPVTGLQGSQGVLGFIESATSFSAFRYQQASSGADKAGILKDRMTLALSNATGVNIDEEMARLLEIENVYKASAKLITAVDTLYQTLFDAIR